MTQPFPPDLPDLLRLACGQGQMRLNVWFGSRENGRKHQANLANSGNGWTIEYNEDPLEAITRVLRIRFGAMLERKRRDETVHIAKPPGGGTGTGVQIDIEEAIAAAPDPIHPDFAEAVAAVPDIDLDGLIG